MLHHDNKVHVTVNGGTDSAVIVDELLFRDLRMKGNELNEQFSSDTGRLKSENRGSDYKKTWFPQMGRKNRWVTEEKKSSED